MSMTTEPCCITKSTCPVAAMSSKGFPGMAMSDSGGHHGGELAPVVPVREDAGVRAERDPDGAGGWVCRAAPELVLVEAELLADVVGFVCP
jgi:hypothetical protein